MPPKRKQEGVWLSQGTGVSNASLEGVHLLLPGHGETGPTLEIYSYDEMVPRGQDLPNAKGFGHISFEVHSVSQLVDKVIANGGSCFGQITEQHIPDVGKLTFVYVKDPEGNLIEIQHWEK